MTTYIIIAHKMKFSTKSVMPACPASFLEERFPTSGNDKVCANTYDAVYNYSELITRHSGVTFVEFIFVMALIGILAAIVVPKINIATSSNASVDGAAYMIASDIRYVQEFAMANCVSKSVIFNPGSSVYAFTPASSLDPSCRLPSGVTISSNFTITFNSLGEPITGGGGSVAVSDGVRTKTISVVNYTGKVNIS